MKHHRRRRRLHGLCAIGASVVLLTGSAPTALADSRNSATPLGIEVPAELHSGDPAVLHITFGKQTETENRAEPVLPGEISGSASIPEPNETPPVNVPEPGTFALLGLGLAALVLRVRRKRRGSHLG